MANFNKNKILIAITATLSLNGCAHLVEHEKVSQEVVTPIEMIDEISKAYKEREVLVNEHYDIYQLNTDGEDLSAIPADLIIDSKVKINATVKDAIDLISSKIPNASVVYKLDNLASLDTPINLEFNRIKVSKLIEIIEEVGDIDVFVKNGVLYISDYMIIEGSISKLESASNAHYSKIRGHLSTILESSSEKVGAKIIPQPVEGKGTPVAPPKMPMVSSTAKQPTIIIDESTGSLYIKATPKTIRGSKSLIENYINASVSFANVELGIYRVSNEKAREIGISVSKIIDNLYTLSSGVQSAGIVNKTLSFERSVDGDNGDILKTGLQMYERNGLISSESSTVLNIYNDIPTSMSDVQTTGYWIPGNLAQNNTTLNGVSVVTYTEDKPEFVTEDVGKTLVFTPRIDLEGKTVNMSIDYSDSKIYKTETFTWQRNLSLGDVVEIKKPLKTENKLKSVVNLSGDKYSLFAGFKSKDGSIERQFIPGLGDAPILNDIGANSTLGSKSDTIFIMKATFPTTPNIKYLSKKK